MSDYSVTAYLPDDILFEHYMGNDNPEHVWFSDAIGHLIAHVEKHMCEANAKEVYDVACILEMKASELRDIYNVWRRRNFEK